MATRRKPRKPRKSVSVEDVIAASNARARAVRNGKGPANKAAAEQVPLAFAVCRALQHGWQHQLEPERGRDEVGFVSVCGSCGTSRTKWINDRTGEVRATYGYPAGYGAKPGEPRLQPFEWRKNLVKRV